MSIYSQVKRLKVSPGALEYRTWDSIRSKIYRKRIQYNKFKLLVQKMIGVAVKDIQKRRKKLNDDIANLPKDFSLPESFDVQ
jgi:anaerobic ribonucleoside-triphosphate reductase